MYGKTERGFKVDYADFAGLLLGIDAAVGGFRSLTFLVQQPRDAWQWPPEVLRFKKPRLVASGGFSAEERSGRSAGSVRSVSPFVCAACVLGSGICVFGSFGCRPLGNQCIPR